MENSVVNRSENVTFMSIADFKTSLGIKSLQVLEREKEDGTVTNFVATETGKTFKAKQGIDVAKPMTFLIPDGVMDNACLVNTSNAAKTLATL